MGNEKKSSLSQQSKSRKQF